MKNHRVMAPSLAMLVLSLSGCGGGYLGTAVEMSGIGGFFGPSTAMEAAKKIQENVGSVTAVKEITAATDPNAMLGGANGYSEVVTIHDKGAKCDPTDKDKLDVPCGAKIELWPDRDAALKRSGYVEGIQDKLGDALGLTPEHHYIEDGFLLRVSGQLPKAVADQYAEQL